MPFLSRAIPLEEILNRHHRFQDLMIAFLLSSLQPPLELFWAADGQREFLWNAAHGLIFWGLSCIWKKLEENLPQHPSKRCKRRCCRFSRNNRGTPSNTCPPRFHGQCLEDQEEPILWNHRRNEKKRNENPSVYSLCHLNVGWILRMLSPFSSSTSSKRLDDEENDKRILLLFPSLFLIGGHSL